MISSTGHIGHIGLYKMLNQKHFLEGNLHYITEARECRVSSRHISLD